MWCVDAVLTTFPSAMETSENVGHQLHVMWLITWEYASLHNIWGLHGGEDLNCSLWGYDTLGSHRWIPAVLEDHTSSIFYPEDGDSKFVQNIGIHISYYMMSEGHTNYEYSCNFLVVQLFGNRDCNCETATTWLQIMLNQSFAEWYERSSVDGSIESVSIM